MPCMPPMDMDVDVAAAADPVDVPVGDMSIVMVMWSWSMVNISLDLASRVFVVDAEVPVMMVGRKIYFLFLFSTMKNVE